MVPMTPEAVAGAVRVRAPGSVPVSAPPAWPGSTEATGETALAAARVPASTASGSAVSSVGSGWKLSQTAPSGGMVTRAEAS